MQAELIEMIKQAAAGLTHGEREWLGLRLASVAAGESVQFLQCSRGQLTGWMERQAAGAGKTADRVEGRPLTSEEKAELEEKTRLALRGDLDTTGQDRLLSLLNRTEAARGNGVRLKDGEEEAVSLRRMNEVHNVEDYRRLKAEIGGGR